MTMHSGEAVSSTDVSLLLRIRHDERDENAWREFVDQYGYRIYSWCLNRNLQATDAEDVTQDVLVKLARKLGSFQYDRNQSFRGWLRRVTENALTDFFRERQDLADGSVILEQLGKLEARKQLIDELEDAFDLELLEEAIRKVQIRVSSERFAVWQRMTQEGAKGVDVARELKMKIATVYTTRSQIQAMIRDEIARLEEKDSEQLRTRLIR
ncbi:MAG: sigma-70 family RNA polymerase sigma factor [Planctomycetales bacterium]|nr:sigma-70 family RNA polymerase sigma factor [Planctomycetales bacterium]